MRRAEAPLGVVAIWLAASAGGCGGPAAGPRWAPTTPGSGPSGSRAGSELGGPDPAASPESALEAEIAGVLAVVAAARELPARRPVRGAVIGRPEMLERLSQQLHEDVPAEVIAAQSELLFALGTVPADFEYERSLLQMMEDQLAGFYEPDDQTMYAMADLEGNERAATLAHELVHALQDQHFGLRERLDYREDANDEQTALHTLAEGDATSAMLDVIQGRPSLDLSDATLGFMLRGGAAIGSGDAVPGIIKRSVVAPYVDGVIAVNAARRQGGWAAVDAMWARPPATTEQLLHPAKWAAGELAIAVAVPPAPPRGPVAAAYHDVEGEQSLRILFEEWAPRFKAEAAGAGWGGDRVVVFSEGSRHAMAWRIVFDDPAAAERAAVIFARGALGSAAADGARGASAPEAEAVRAIAPGEMCQDRPARGPIAVVRRGSALAVVAGPYLREGGRATSDGECAGALAWGRQVASASAPSPAPTAIGGGVR